MSQAERALQAYLRTVQESQQPYGEEDPSIPSTLANTYNNPAMNVVDSEGVPMQTSMIPYSTASMYSTPDEEAYALPAFDTSKKYTLTDLSNDAEFQEISERFMEAIGENEDIYEYLRDPNFSISAAFQRSIDVGNWSDQTKQDYVWLQNVFENAELGGFKETMGMLKDLSIDLLADPVNWLAMAFAAPSMGMSLSTQATLRGATNNALKKMTKSSINRLENVGMQRALGGAAKAGKYTAAEGVVYGGAHDFFLQDAEKELGLRENFDMTQTALVAGIGGTLGGVLGGATGFFTAYSPLLRTKIYRYGNEDAIIKQSKRTDKKTEHESWETEELLNVPQKDSGKYQLDLFDEDQLDEFVGTGTRTEEGPSLDPIKRAKKSLDAQLEKGQLSALTYWSKRAALGYFGKSTSIIAKAASKSPQLAKFLGQLRYDFADTIRKGVDPDAAPRGFTYEENVSRQQGTWKTLLEQAMQPLLRATFKDGDNLKAKLGNLFNDSLDYDQNEQLLRLLFNPDATEVTYKSKTGQTITLSRDQIDPNIIKAADQIKDLTNNVWREAVGAGLLNADQFIENYFPRYFQRDKILADKDRFIGIIEESIHAAPANAYAMANYILPAKSITKVGKLNGGALAKIKKANIKADGRSWTQVTENNITRSEMEKLARINVSELYDPYNQATGKRNWVDQKYYGTDFIKDALEEKGFNPNRFIRDDDVLGNQEIIADIPEDVMQLAKRKKATAIVDHMLLLGEDHGFDAAYLEAVNFKKAIVPGNFKNRIFDTIPDEAFEDFIDRDVNRVLTNYLTGSARTIQRANLFGKSESVFKTNYIDKIRTQLKAEGVSTDEINTTVDRVELLYKRTTGLEVPTWEDVVGDKKLGGAITGVTDFFKVSQQLAHLPLATLSSVTEPLILLSRINNPNVVSKEGLDAAIDVGSAMKKGMKKNFERWSRFNAKLRGKKVTGMKDISEEDWQEVYKAGLALEQSTMDRLQGLYGEAPRAGWLRTTQNAFFHVNLLTQWTGAVQLAAYTTGKRIMRENAELLYNHTNKTKPLNKRELDRAKGRLLEAGLSPRQSITWYRNSLDDNGNFDDSLAQGLRGRYSKKQKAFYENYYQRAATRFAKEIILVPTTAAANRPLWHSHPAGQLLAQFAGYPTAFNNTILKRFAREMYTDPIHASPKIVATTVMMTSVATLMNAIRSQGDSLEQEPGEILTRSIQRWGGMGPLELAYRYKTNAGFGSGQMGSLLKAPAGPLAQDVIDMILYRKGFAEMTANNLPGSAAYQMVFGDKYKDWLMGHARQLDKNWTTAFGPQKKVKEKVGLYGFAIGGEVNVPNAKKEPDEKIDRLTGLPYNYQAGVLGQDEEERFGFYGGGLIRQVFHGSPYRFNTFNVKRLGTGEGFHAYGPGFYFADDKEIAKKYAKDLTESKKDVLSEIEYRNEKGFTPEEIAEFEGRERRSQDVISTFQDDPSGFISLLRFHSLSSDNLKHVITEEQASSVWSQFIVPYLVKHKKLDNLIKSDDWNKIQNQIQETVYAVNLKIRDDQILDYDKVFTLQDPTVQKNLQRIYNSLGKRDSIENKTGEEIIKSFRETYVPLEEALPSYEKTRLLNKKYRHPGARILEYNIDEGEKLLDEAGIKATRFLDGFSRAEGKGTSNWVVKDTRLIEISKIFGVTIPVAAGILAMIDEGASIEDVQRQGFKEGGLVKDDTEIMSYLTKHSRMSPPYLNSDDLMEMYSEEELKDYAKGITETVYRKMESNTDIEHLEDFELRDDIGVHVHTGHDEHQAGKIRLNNPLDLRMRNIKDFKAYNFIDQIISNEMLKNTIVKHSKLPKLEAQERIKDLIADYRFAVKAVSDEKPANRRKVEFALNNKISKDARNILNELGYDGIIYNKGKEKAAILFEPGQFRAIEGSAPMQSETDGQMESLGFEREQRFLGGFFKRRNERLKDRKERGITNTGDTNPLARLLKTRVGKNLDSNKRWAILDLIGDTADRTEKDLSHVQNKLLRKISADQIKKGENGLGYSQWKTGKSTSHTGIFGKASNVSQNIDKLKETEEGDARYNLSTTLGNAQIERDNDGVYYVKDRYNFNRLTENEGELKSWGLAAYAALNRNAAGDQGYGFQRALMGAVGSEEGEGSYVNIRLGTAKELGLSRRQDNRWTKKHGDKKWKSGSKKDHGFFGGLDTKSLQADLAKLGTAQKGMGADMANKITNTLSYTPEYSDIKMTQPGIDIKMVDKKEPPQSLLAQNRTDNDNILAMQNILLGKK